MPKQLIVIGAGAAGMIAAITAAHAGCSVRLIERNEKMGRKLYITGKGRCNVTNHCSGEEVLAATIQNSRFLYSAISNTPPAYIETYFTNLGVPLKVERGGRVFPQSDRASDIIDALFLEIKRLGITVTRDRITQVVTQAGSICTAVGEKGRYGCDAVVLATGGASYPGTGSTGDGYEIASSLGHTIIDLKPSLIPLETVESFCKEMQGLSLKNVELKIKNQKKKVIFQEQGEMLFTHFGVSGPLVLRASAYMRDFDHDAYTGYIDLKPALDEQTLDARLVRELAEGANKDFGNILSKLLPRLMIPVVAQLAGIALHQKGHEVTKGDRRRLLETLKGLTFHIRGPRPLEEAIVTAGGVKTGEVDPKTMMSKKISGLFFAGELLDVDAFTGGYNLQIAWATGRTAGDGAVKYLGV